ncbi:MAG: hypothetical protein WA790_11980 [Sulfitobacter sp.]
MDWSTEMELTLIELGALTRLSQDIRERLPLKPDEIKKKFEEYQRFVGLSEASSEQLEASLYAEIDHRRWVEQKDKQKLRVTRKVIFASAYSSLERFLVLRLGANPKANILTLQKKLRKSSEQNAFPMSSKNSIIIALPEIKFYISQALFRLLPETQTKTIESSSVKIFLQSAC